MTIVTAGFLAFIATAVAPAQQVDAVRRGAPVPVFKGSDARALAPSRPAPEPPPPLSTSVKQQALRHVRPGLRFRPGFSLTPNRPYLPDKGKLHFHHPASVQTGGTKLYENFARFEPLDATNTQFVRFLQIGVKAAAGESFVIDCAVKGAATSPNDRYELVGPGQLHTVPIAQTHLTFALDAQIAQWFWFSIAATAPWTFYACEVMPAG